MANESKDVNVEEEVDNLDIGIPMYATAWNFLRDTDTSGVKQIFYGKKRDLAYIVNCIGYKGFRNDLNDKNKGRGLDRRTTEAMWIDLLLQYYESTHVNEIAIKANISPSEASARKQKLLCDACYQRNGAGSNRETSEELEAYWVKRKELYPEIDITYIAPDSDADHPGHSTRNGEDRGDDESIDRRSVYTTFNSEDMRGVKEWRLETNQPLEGKGKGVGEGGAFVDSEDEMMVDGDGDGDGDGEGEVDNDEEYDRGEYDSNWDDEGLEAQVGEVAGELEDMQIDG